MYASTDTSGSIWAAVIFAAVGFACGAALWGLGLETTGLAVVIASLAVLAVLSALHARPGTDGRPHRPHEPPRYRSLDEFRQDRARLLAAYTVRCFVCRALAFPIPRTKDRYECRGCHVRFAGPEHRLPDAEECVQRRLISQNIDSSRCFRSTNFSHAQRAGP